MKLGLRLLLVSGAAGTACACGSIPGGGPLQPPPIAASPVAAQVEQASRSEGPFPSLQRIPRAPTDVRPTRAWSRSIYDMLRLRRQMLIEAAMAGPAPTDTDSFAARERAATTAPGSASAAAAAALDQTASFVEGGRERATPPSPAR